MSDDPDPNRLSALQDRIDRAKGAEAPTRSAVGDAHTQGQLAWRMVTELVAGLLIGFGIGYGADALLGTQPWLMLVFTLLGFAAGVNVMIRSAREAEKTQGAEAPTDDGAGAPQDERDD